MKLVASCLGLALLALPWIGAASAAPIARRAFDYWLLGLYPSEEDMALVSKGQATAPVGKQRLASEVAWPAGGTPAAEPTQEALRAAYVARRRPVAP